MIRLSPHRARERQQAWIKAQSTLDSVALTGTAHPSVLDSWTAAGIMARWWSRIEDSLWELRHQPIRRRLKAAVRKQKHRP